MWQTGTTDDYLTALQDLKDVATGTHVSVAAVNAGGTGYTAGDVLSVAGGTSTHTATIVVTAVSSGVITAVRMGNGGAYTVNPTTTANAVTGGTGSSATMNLTMTGTGWTQQRREYRGARATVAAGGTGYSVNDKLTISGGTSTTAAVFNVDSVSSGVVTAVSIDTVGYYTVLPSNPASTTGGGGSGCTLTAEWEQELILEGEGAGADDITVGIKTYQTLDGSGFNTCFNWAVFGMTSYNSGLKFFEQPGISPGFTASPASDPDLSSSLGAFVPLRNTDGSYPITYWFRITKRAIVCVFKVEDSLTTHYMSLHLGYTNQLGTTSELPFPMYVAGCSYQNNIHFEDTTRFITGLTEMAGGDFDNGPGFSYRSASSSWAGIDNSKINTSGTSRTASNDSSVYPGGDHTLQPDTGPVVNDGWGSWNDIIPDSGVPGSPTLQIYPTEDSGGDLYWLIPATVIDADNAAVSFLPYGEIDGVFWVGRGGVLTSEDTITIGSDIYRVFQNGNRTNEWSYMAIKETF